jgi:hypothetical protein
MPTATPRHQWTLRFDRVTCRDCGAPRNDNDNDADETCAGAAKIRPMAGIRQLHEDDCCPIRGCSRCRGRDEFMFKPDLSRHPKLKKARDQWQADRGRA